MDDTNKVALSNVAFSETDSAGGLGEEPWRGAAINPHAVPGGLADAPRAAPRRAPDPPPPQTLSIQANGKVRAARAKGRVPRVTKSINKSVGKPAPPPRSPRFARRA